MVDYVKECREQADNTFYGPLKESWTMVGDYIEHLENRCANLLVGNGILNIRIEKLEAALDKYMCNCVPGIEESVCEVLEGEDG